MRVVGIFLWAVARHSVALIGSAAVSVYQLAAQYWNFTPLPVPTYLALILLSVFIGCFQAWRNEYIVASAKKALEIVFDPKRHFTEHGSGLRRYRITVLNRGTSTIHRVSVRIKSISSSDPKYPRDNSLTEVPLVPLHEESSTTPKCEISLDPDSDGRMFNFVQQDGKGKSFEIIHGMGISDITDGEEGEEYTVRYRSPDGRLYGKLSYRVVVTAVGEDVLSRDVTFLLRPDKDFRLEVEVIGGDKK